MSRPIENVRVRRTRKLLRDALVELIEERGFDRLTVGEITERAMISRAGFYRNYRDKYHLVEQIFDEAMAALVDTMAEDELRSSLERWAGFFEHIATYERLYGALLGQRGSPWFARRMRASLAAMVTEHIREVPAPDGLVPTVLGAMFVQAITWWLEHGRPESAAAMADRTGRMAAAVIAEANTSGHV